MVLAEVELRFPYNELYDIKRPCYNNGTICSGAAQCNFTLSYPNGRILLDNAIMTNNVSYHNVTVLKSQNNELGIHPAKMYCCDTGGQCGADTFEIEITGDGFSKNNFPLQFSVLIFGIILIVVGHLKEELNIFNSVGSIVVLIMGILTLYPGYADVNYSTLMGQMIGVTSIGMGGYFLIAKSFSRGEQSDHYDQKYNEYDLDDGRFHG